MASLENDELKIIWDLVVLDLCPDAGQRDMPYKTYFYLCKEMLRLQFHKRMLMKLVRSYINDDDKFAELEAELIAAGDDVVNDYIIKVNEVLDDTSSDV